MNKKLLDILVCPFDKVSSLELFQFKAKASFASVNTISNNEGQDSKNTLTSENENGRKMNDASTNSTSNSVSDMNEGTTEIVEEGLLLCRSCLRFYPITEEIPIILPDELRDKKKDLEFLKTWNESIPNDLLKNLRPWTL
jgi:uncharacterized protein